MRSCKNILIKDWYGTSRSLAIWRSASKSDSGKRREIDRVDGFKFGNKTRSASFQFIYSEESCSLQKSRSSSSSLNLGIDLLINIALLFTHIAGRDHADFVFSNCKCNKQMSISNCMTEYIISRLFLGVCWIWLKQ